MTYHALFSRWSDVEEQFGCAIKEPTQVLLAWYEYEDYSGSAFLIFRRGRSWFTASGSHCSCYGLEGQWEEEGPMTKSVLREMLRKMDCSSYGYPMPKDHRDAALAALG